MCGIFGILKLKNRSFPGKEGHYLLKHRGPDESAQYEDADIFLAHHRLSIIDLSSGKQPMSNEDGSIICVYNGEIYNYKALAEELRGKGHSFSTQSDTEVLIHCYEGYGEDCLKKMNGVFSFALWNKKTKKLFCARDRLGIKPFYYTITPDAIYFSSEIKALSALEKIQKTLNTESLFQYLAFLLILFPLK